jgi:hypothetical protein
MGRIKDAEEDGTLMTRMEGFSRISEKTFFTTEEKEGRTECTEHFVGCGPTPYFLLSHISQC